MYRRVPLLGDSGNAVIEFALVAPILMALFTGVWDFGNCFLQSQRLASAARAGAQYGIQAPANATDFPGMVQAARNDANDTAAALTINASQLCFCPNGVAVACTGSCAGIPQPYFYVKLVVSESYTTTFDYPFITNPLSLSTQIMLRQQ
jgi:Flp pilus assembly protein TadG